MAGEKGGVVEYMYPGDVLTLKAGGAITGGQVVALDATADMQVIVATAATGPIFGVALFTVAVGEMVTVARVGIYYLTATGAVARGDTVNAAAAGTVATGIQALTNLGIALESIANAAKGRVALRLA